MCICPTRRKERNLQNNFDQCFEWLLAHEGGYVNNPRDLGGMTNLGVTASNWQNWTHSIASETTMRDLTPDDVRPFYRVKYWNALSCDALPSGVEWAVFDFGVNSGILRSAKYLQRVLGVNQDGYIGQLTIDAAKVRDPKELIAAVCDARQEFLQSLSTFSQFGRGWLRRVNEVRTQAESLVV